MKLLYKLIYVIAAKVAAWAGKKAGIEDEQKKSAEKAEKAIKDAADAIKDKPVDPKTRPDDDVFDNDTFNGVR